MSSKAKTRGAERSIFADIEQLPPPVSADALSDLGFEEADFSGYAKAASGGGRKSSGGFLDIEDLIGSRLDDAIDQDIRQDDIDDAEIDEDEEAEGDYVEVDDNFWDDIDEDLEFVFDIYQDGRIWLHSKMYDYFIDTTPARKVFSELMNKGKSRTDQEEALMQQLWQFIQLHENQRKEFVDAIPWSERHKDRAMRWLKAKILKWQGKKRIPAWLVPVIIFVLPELRLAGKLAAMRDRIPKPTFAFAAA